MSAVLALNPNFYKPFLPISQIPHFNPLKTGTTQKLSSNFCSVSTVSLRQPRLNSLILNAVDEESNDNTLVQDNEANSAGVELALSMLRFYKREISPLLPNSCRYVPTCSEYSMQAYKKYGVAKGTVLTAWRLCRCNPIGGSGFDPPRWFDEPKPSQENDI